MSTDDVPQQSTQTKKNKKRPRDSKQEQVPFKKQRQNEVTETTTTTTTTASVDPPAIPNGSTQKEMNKKQKKQQALSTAPNNTVSSTLRKKIKLSDDHLQKQSPFVNETQSLFLGLSPIAHRFPLEGACAEFISPLLLTYYPPLNGVVLSYSNPRLTQHPEHAALASSSQGPQKVMGRSIDEYAVTYIWLTADFLVFRPVIGTVLEGYVNLQNQSILGLLCYNYFNAGIDQSRLPSDWKWVEDEELEEPTNTRGRHVPKNNGQYVDASGKVVEGKILFKVKDFEATAGIDGGSGSINIYGTLLQDKDDAKADAELRQLALVS